MPPNLVTAVTPVDSGTNRVPRLINRKTPVTQIQTTFAFARDGLPSTRKLEA